MDDLSLRYDGGGVDPSLPEFVLFLFRPCWWSMLVSMADNSSICCWRGSVTTTTFELRALSEAPLMPDFNISMGILEADQRPLNRTKTRLVVTPWLRSSQYTLVMIPRTVEIIANTTKAEMIWMYVLPSIEKAGDIFAPTRSVISSWKLKEGRGSNGFPSATYPLAMFLAIIWAFRTFL